MKSFFGKILVSCLLVTTLASSLKAQDINPSTPVSADPVIAGWVIGLGSVAVAVADSLLGNTQRQCTSSYRFTVLNSHEAVDTYSTGLFASVGGCGKTVPDRCRRRARDRAHECMVAHWSNAAAPFSPGECENTDGSIHNYNISQLDSYIQASVCRVRAPGSYNIRLESVTQGNTGCNKQTVLAPSYNVVCP